MTVISNYIIEEYIQVDSTRTVRHSLFPSELGLNRLEFFEELLWSKGGVGLKSPY